MKFELVQDFRGEVVQRTTDGQTGDGRQVITIAHPELSAQVAAKAGPLESEITRVECNI